MQMFHAIFLAQESLQIINALKSFGKLISQRHFFETQVQGHLKYSWDSNMELMLHPSSSATLFQVTLNLWFLHLAPD